MQPQATCDEVQNNSTLSPVISLLDSRSKHGRRAAPDQLSGRVSICSWSGYKAVAGVYTASEKAAQVHVLSLQ